ncbi:MAG TPA: DUF4349 domain-containing protein [Gemmatimonadaceae bacterium]|nr:DUF4349 domain-containing protein [Gemmatimonadaceae bacterium]
MSAPFSRWQAAAALALVGLVAAIGFAARRHAPAAEMAVVDQTAAVGGVAGFASAAPPVAARDASMNVRRAKMEATTDVRAPQNPGAATMLIRNGDVSIQVDSVGRAIDAVRALAASLGGYVGNVSTSTGEHQVHSATLSMQVPAARFEDAMSGVKPLGEVERSNATVEDVGEEFVDVSARIANGRRVEERLVRLLATRTGKLDDVLSVERELARVREEIDRQEARIRYLSAHIAMSAISVTVHEKPPLVATNPGDNVIRAAFVGMWRNMVGIVAFGIEMFGAVLPPLVLALIGVLVWRRMRRRTVTTQAI